MLDWLKTLYGAFGADHPLLSCAVISLIGAIVFGCAWWAVGKGYRHDHPIVEIAKPPIQTVRSIIVSELAPSLIAELTSVAEVKRTIEWDFDRPGSIEHRHDALFGFGSGTAGFWVTYFRISGTNISSEPLVDVGAYVVPQIYGKKVALQFEIEPNRRVDTHGYVIQPGAKFVLAAAVPSPPHGNGSHGYTALKYLEKMGGFDFVFEAKGVHEERGFSYSEIKAMISVAENVYGPKPPAPAVIPRG